jgi:hypothetical protein
VWVEALVGGRAVARRRTVLGPRVTLRLSGRLGTARRPLRLRVRIRPVGPGSSVVRTVVLR